MGSYHGAEVKKCEAQWIVAYVAKPNTSANTKLGLFGKECFRYDATADVYRCPAGEALTYRFSTVEQGRSIRTYSTAACSTCALKPQCTRNKESRRITRWEDEAVLERMEQRVSEHPDIMRKRKMLAEHPFGTIKRWMDQSYFLMRGQDKVSAEASLTVLAYNIKRVINILGVTPLVRALAQVVDAPRADGRRDSGAGSSHRWLSAPISPRMNSQVSRTEFAAAVDHKGLVVFTQSGARLDRVVFSYAGDSANSCFGHEPRLKLLAVPRSVYNVQAQPLKKLPERGRALDRSGQDRVSNVVDCPQVAWRSTSPLESGRGRRPVKQRHVPGVEATAALIVNEGVIISRAPRRDQPTDRQLRIDDHVGDLELGSGLRDVQGLAAEQRLQPIADAERQSSDGRDNLEPLVIQVSPQRPGHCYVGCRLVAGNQDRPEAHANRAEQLCAAHPTPAWLI
jgi:hypothetical protein